MLLSHHPPCQYNRTFLIFGKRFCVRCTGILLGIFISTIFLFIKKFDWWLILTILLILPLPAIFNFTLNELGKIKNNNIKRFITGGLLGISIGLALIELFFGIFLLGFFIILYIFFLEIIVVIILNNVGVLESFIKQYEEGIYKE